MTDKLLTATLALLALAGGAQADALLWFEDLTTPPPGWSCWGFDFTPWGAHLYEIVDYFPNRPPGAGGPAPLIFVGSMYTDTVLVPDGIDSLVIHVPQTLNLSVGGESISASATLAVFINGEESALYQRSVYEYMADSRDSYADSLPLHYSIVDVSSGDEVYFRFYSESFGWSGSATINWKLWDAQLVGFGDLAFRSESWAAIKALGLE